MEETCQTRDFIFPRRITPKTIGVVRIQTFITNSFGGRDVSGRPRSRTELGLDVNAKVVSVTVLS